MKTNQCLMNLAAVFGGLAVVMGAFGAHGLEKSLDERMLEVFHTGVRYHMYHALALLGLAVYPVSPTPAFIKRAAWAWVIGIIIFSGTLYTLALTGMSWLGMITPIGGVALILGWVFLVSFGSKTESNPDAS